MKLTRRAFLNGLLATGAAVALAPRETLAELTHGASDLTPRERDVVAEVMGLRREQWAGWNPYRYVTIDGGPRHALESFGISRPEPVAEFGEQWRYTEYRGGWSGYVSVGLNDADLLKDALNFGAYEPSVKMRIVIGDQVVCDEWVKVNSYGLIDGQVELGVRQANPASSYATLPIRRGSWRTVDNLGLTIGPGTTIIGLGNPSDRPSFAWDDKRPAETEEVAAMRKAIEAELGPGVWCREPDSAETC